MQADCSMSIFLITYCIKLFYNVMELKWSQEPGHKEVLVYTCCCQKLMPCSACTQLLAHNCLQTVALYLMLRQQDASL